MAGDPPVLSFKTLIVHVLWRRLEVIRMYHVHWKSFAEVICECNTGMKRTLSHSPIISHLHPQKLFALWLLFSHQKSLILYSTSIRTVPYWSLLLLMWETSKAVKNVNRMPNDMAVKYKIDLDLSFHIWYFIRGTNNEP